MRPQNQPLVLILDFGSQVTQLIARRVREAGVYCEIHPFDKAEALVDKSRSRAEGLADQVEPAALRQLLYFLVDMVLAPESNEPAIARNDLLSLPVVAV